MELVEEKQKVRIIAAKSDYHTAPYFVAAKPDPKTKKYNTGQKFKDDEEKASAVFVIDPDESYPIRHLDVFDLTQEVDKIMYEFFKLDPAIAPNKASVNPGVHRFYWEDKEEDAKATIKSITNKRKAFVILDKLGTLEEMQDFGRLVGIMSKDANRTLLEGSLVEMADTKPKKIVDAYDDKSRKERAFLRKAMVFDVIKKVSGKYMFNQEVIGVNEDYAIEYIKDSNNSRVVAQWASMMGMVPKSKTESPKEQAPDVVKAEKKTPKATKKKTE